MGSVFLSIDQSHIQEQPKKIHICSCCGDSIVGEHYILSQTDMLCSEECFKIYRENKFNRPRKVCKSKNMCVHCKSEILTDDFISHEHKKFCSDTCFQEWREHDILIKCRRGELSFLDIPKEIREKYDGRISKRTVTASNECVICGCIFHLSNKITRLNARTDELFIEEQKLFHKAHNEGLDFDYDLREWRLKKECE